MPRTVFLFPIPFFCSEDHLNIFTNRKCALAATHTISLSIYQAPGIPSAQRNSRSYFHIIHHQYSVPCARRVNGARCPPCLMRVLRYMPLIHDGQMILFLSFTGYQVHKQMSLLWRTNLSVESLRVRSELTYAALLRGTSFSALYTPRPQWLTTTIFPKPFPTVEISSSL